MQSSDKFPWHWRNQCLYLFLFLYTFCVYLNYLQLSRMSPIAVQQVEIYWPATCNLLDWVQNNMRFTGLGLTKDDITKKISGIILKVFRLLHDIIRSIPGYFTIIGFIISEMWILVLAILFIYRCFSAHFKLLNVKWQLFLTI